MLPTLLLAYVNLYRGRYKLNKYFLDVNKTIAWKQYEYDVQSVITSALWEWVGCVTDGFKLSLYTYSVLVISVSYTHLTLPTIYSV